MRKKAWSPKALWDFSKSRGGFGPHKLIYGSAHASHGCTILLIYVDDMIIRGNDAVGISKLKTYLIKTFKMMDLGSLTYFLGLEIFRTKEGIRVGQTKYIEDLVKSTPL